MKLVTFDMGRYCGIHFYVKRHEILLEVLNGRCDLTLLNFCESTFVVLKL